MYRMVQLARQIGVAELLKVLIKRLSGQSFASLLKQRGGNFSGAVLAFAMRFAQGIARAKSRSATSLTAHRAKGFYGIFCVLPSRYHPA